MVELSNKWALITGASRGVGRQVATGLAARGCHLVLHSRERAHTQELEQALGAQGVQVVSVGAELSDEASVERMMDEALAASGGSISSTTTLP
jgi:short-subunit dehydrogenase